MDTNTFSLDDYDCIGFDLDCTLAEYKLKETMQLIYDSLADYLIREKSYDRESLLRPFQDEDYFLQKGLFMDLKKGNILKVNKEGIILRATHGTKRLSDGEIVNEYGQEKTLNMFGEFIENPLLITNNAHQKVLRTALHCFDMPCLLLFARVVDSLDKKNNGVSKVYNIWPDIQAGLFHLYNRDHFISGESAFYAAFKKEPSLYYKKWSPEKLAWLKRLKSKKFVYLLTNSFVAFASLTAGYCIGEDWKDYFDIVLCFGGKPLFFSSHHPFMNVKNDQECGPVEEEEDLQVNSTYSQGNWVKLKDMISKQTNIKEPKCLYVGDNLIQDMYAPVSVKACDSVAVLFELKGEFRTSKVWGPYFETNKESPSFWNHLTRKNVKICVSGLDVFLDKPLTFQYNCLKERKCNKQNETDGYYVN